MKKVTLLLIGIAIIFLSACSSGTGNEAAISFELGKGILPDKAVSIDDLRHIIVLSGPTGKQSFSISGGGTFKTTVSPGLWRIDVEAFLGDELYAKGSATAEVKVGQTTKVTIMMNVVWASTEGGGGGSTSGNPTYTITIQDNGNGTASASHSSASQGTTVTLTAIPNPGYYLKQWQVISGGAAPSTVTANTATFGMPGSDVIILADFDVFVPVTNISGFPATATVGTPLILSGTVGPANASFQTIVWDITAQGSTGANITNGNTFNATAAGTATLTATITDGTAIGIDFSPTFTITVSLPAFSGTVSISGGDWTYGTLTAVTSSLTPSTGSFNYEWKRGATQVQNSSSNTYSVVPADLGSTITVEVTLSTHSGTPSATKAINRTGVRNFTELDDIKYGLTGNYVLLSNVTLPTGWTPIGPNFTGKFDGNGNEIYFNSTSDSLFTTVGPTGTGTDLAMEVKNLKLTGSIVNHSSSGYVGAVANTNRGKISNVASTVSVTSTTGLAGGIAGTNWGTITNCYSTGNVTANNTTYGAGGIAGRNNASTGVISYCWASGTVTGNRNTSSDIAGISTGAALATNCVALNSILNNIDSSYVGGTSGCYRIGVSNASNNYNFGNLNTIINTGVPGTWNAATQSGLNGESVSITTTQQTDGGWWTGGAGPQWTTATVWGGSSANDSKPWKWGTVNSQARPVLWFE